MAEQTSTSPSAGAPPATTSAPAAPAPAGGTRNLRQKLTVELEGEPVIERTLRLDHLLALEDEFGTSRPESLRQMLYLVRLVLELGAESLESLGRRVVGINLEDVDAARNGDAPAAVVPDPTGPAGASATP